MKTLVLVQHCQSQHHINREADRWPDRRNGLTETGRRQAQLLAQRLHKELEERPCRIHTSRMQRAMETARIIGECLHAEPQAAADLHELNGRFAMARTEDEPERVVDNSNWSLFDWRPFPQAETWRQFHARVCAAMEQIARGHPAECVPIVVAHGGTLSNIVAWWLRLPLDVLPERTPFAASPGSITVLKTNKFGKPVVDRLNDTAHLDVAGLGGGLNLGA
jgi:broad specificity phosphatase PhoE